MLSPEKLKSLGCRQRGGGVPRCISRKNLAWSGWAIDGAWPSSAARRFTASINSRARSTSPNCHIVTAKPGHRRRAGVLAEAFARLPIALRVAGRERTLAMDTRVREFAEPIADYGEAAADDANFREATQALRLLQET